MKRSKQNTDLTAGTRHDSSNWTDSKEFSWENTTNKCYWRDLIVKTTLNLSPARGLILEYRSRCTHLIIFFILSKSFFSHYHSFPLVLKHKKSVHIFEMLYIPQSYTRACRSQCWASGGRQLFFWLVIFFGLVPSLKLQIELSGIHWSRKVSYLPKSRLSSHCRRDTTRCAIVLKRTRRTRLYFFTQNWLLPSPLSSAEASFDYSLLGRGNIKAHGDRWEGGEGEGKFLLPITPCAPLSSLLCGWE